MLPHSLSLHAIFFAIVLGGFAQLADSAEPPAGASKIVLLDEGNDPATWRLNLGSEFPGAVGAVSLSSDGGRPCLKLAGDFTAGGRYCGIGQEVMLPAATHISFSVKATVSMAGMIRLRDATNQEHFASFRTTKPNEWEQVSLPLKREVFRGFWSGAKDGEFHFPLRRVLIGLSVSSEKKPSFLIRDVTITTAATSQFWAMDVETNRPGNILFIEEAGNRAFLKVRNRTTSPQTATLTWRVTDHTGTITDQGSETRSFAKWQIHTLPLKLVEPLQPGYYYVEGTIQTAAGLTVVKDGGIGIVPQPKNLGQSDPSCFFGIHPRNLDRVVRIGAKWLRPTRSWRWGEARQGDYLWPDRPIEGVAEQKSHIMMTLHYSPPGWARKLVEGKPLWPPPQILLDHWANYVTACVKHYDGVVDAWEIQNEPDLTCFHHAEIPLAQGVKSYVDIFRTAHAAIRAAGSKHPIAGIDVSGGDYRRNLQFSRAVLAEISDLLDIYTGHPYASPRYFGEGKKPLFPHQNKLVEKLKLSRDMCDGYGGRPLWIGEKGWGLHISEALAGSHAYGYGACTAQALATARSVRGVERWFWFLERGCNERGHEYGLWRVSPDQPLPAAVAYATSAAQLRHVKPVKRLQLSEDLRGFAFRTEDTKEGVVALWSVADSFRLPGGILPGTVDLVDCYGRPVAAETCVFTSAPTYLRTPQDNLARLCSALEKGGFAPSHAVAVEAVFRCARNTLAVRLRNKVSSSQTVTIDVAGATVDATLDGQALLRTELSLPRELAADSRVKIVQGAQMLFDERIPLAPAPCRKLSSMPALVPEKWGEAVAVLSDREQILPPDPNIGWHGADDLGMKIWLGWTDAGLRVGIEVADDKHVVPFAGAGNFWKSDSIQIAVDGENDAMGADEFDDDDREFGLVLGTNGAAVYQTVPGAGARSAAVVQAKRVDGKTLYQVLIPWTALGRRPQAGEVLGINVIANDNDGHGREYWMGMTPGIGESKRPSVYRDFYLAE